LADVAKSILHRVETEIPHAPAGTRPPFEVPPVPPREPPRTRGRLRVALLAGLAALTLAVWVTVSRRASRPEVPVGEVIRTVTVERGEFVYTLRLSGTTEAVQSRAVLAPMLAGSQLGSLVITKLVPAGGKVKPGDLLVEFDRQSQIKNFLDKQAEFRDLVDQIARKQAEGDAARAKDETELKQAENALKKAELEVQKNEVISSIDAEKNLEALEQAKANLKQLQETFDLKRSAAKADFRILEIQRDRAREAMLHAQHNEELMSIHSPMAGVVVLNTIWKQGKWGEVQEGDEVRPGVPFMQVVNPSAMQVRVSVNQADFLGLGVGQSAEVRLDAYPEMVFPAKLEQLAPIGNNGQFSDKVRTFSALFSIQGSDPRLMPDLSAAVDVEIERRANVLLVPRETVITENGRDYIRVKRGLGFEKRLVTIGRRDDLKSVVESGLQAGEVIQRNAG